MKALIATNSSVLPTLVVAAGERAAIRFLEFFAANIRNSHMRRAYYRAAEEFLAWCASVGGAIERLSSRCMSLPGLKHRTVS